MPDKPANGAPFIVYAPRFDAQSGGAIALHRLVHLLRDEGEDAYLWPMGRPSMLRHSGLSLWLRRAYYALLALKNGAFQCHRAFDTPIAQDAHLPGAVVVYPETVTGDPLGVGACVRWLLHKPGFHTGTVAFGKHDILFHYQHEFAPVGSSLPSGGMLQTLWVRDDLYHHDEQEETRRTGECYMVRKGDGLTPRHGSDALCLDGLAPEAVADVFRRRERFYSYDPFTLYSAYAAACGCESIVVPPEGMDKSQWFEDEAKRFGVAFGDSDEELAWARATRHRALENLKDDERAARETVRRFVRISRAYFGGGAWQQEAAAADAVAASQSD